MKPQKADFGDLLQINLLSIRKELLYTSICEFLDFRGLQIFASVSVFRNVKDARYEASNFQSCESNLTGTFNFRKSTNAKFLNSK